MNKELEIGELYVADLPMSSIELSDVSAFSNGKDMDLFALVAHSLGPMKNGATREVYEIPKNTAFLVLARTFANYVVLCDEKRLIVSYQLINHLAVINSLRKVTTSRNDNESRSEH